MPKRLAITVAGAVSLGSFEAGVMYEIISAIKQHNADPATGPSDRIEIDVLTGASAGGMTAAVATQKLLFDAPSLENAYSNALYQPWVIDIGFDGLFNLQNDENASESILSSEEIDRISRAHLTDRFKSVARTISPHPAAASEIKIGLAMSNLNGIDFRHLLTPSGSFIYSRYQDQVSDSFKIDTSFDTLALWEPIRVAAVACGAFPFAFRVREILRAQSEFTDPNVVPFTKTPFPFVYTDGGVFQNEPLGLAKNLVDTIDDHQNVDSRFYLFVSPGARNSTAAAGFSADGANYKMVLQQLLGAVFQQSRFHDWITAESVNEKLRIFNDRALELKQALVARSLDNATLGIAARAILRLQFAPTSSFGETQSQAETRLKTQFAREYQDLVVQTTPAAADDWIDSILVLETAADLSSRDEMKIYSVVASDAELASSQVMAFIGFFDQSYRDHDYDIGRTKAQQFLQSAEVNGPGQIGPIRFTPTQIRPIDHTLDGLQLQSVSEDLRQKMKDRLADRASKLLVELEVPWIARKPIEWWFVSPHLKKLLGL